MENLFAMNTDESFNMRHINKKLGSVAAVVGVLISPRNWFVMLVVPAIQDQKWALGLMVGTHGRRGLLLGNRWLFNK